MKPNTLTSNTAKRLAAVLLLQLLAFWPIWGWYARRMSDGSDEPWGLLALITALLFLFFDTLQEPQETEKGKRLCLNLALLPLAIYCITYGMLPQLAAAVLAVLCLCLSCSAFCKDGVVRFSVLGLLLLSLPIIASLQFYAGYPIRLLTAHLASILISLTGFETVAQGTLLEWAGELIAVDAPCSGIKMLWTGLYLCFSLSCFYKLSSTHAWLAYSISSLLIFSGNVLRASALFYFEAGILKKFPFYHSGIGLLLFGLVALAIFFLHQRISHYEDN